MKELVPLGVVVLTDLGNYRLMSLGVYTCQGKILDSWMV